MNTWFANLSVTRKLALGFGLVLALTLALAWTAWSGLGSVIQRSSWMSEITQLNATLTNLRIARLQFMLAKGDAPSTERLLTNLDIYLQQQKKLLGTFTNPVNVKLLQEQDRYNQDYQRSLAGMRAAYAAAAKVRDQAAVEDQQLSELLATMRRSIELLPEYDANRFPQLQALTATHGELLRLRYLLERYDSAPDAKPNRRCPSVSPWPVPAWIPWSRFLVAPSKKPYAVSRRPWRSSSRPCRRSRAPRPISPAPVRK